MGFQPHYLGHNLSCYLVYIWSRMFEGQVRRGREGGREESVGEERGRWDAKWGLFLAYLCITLYSFSSYFHITFYSFLSYLCYLPSNILIILPHEPLSTLILLRYCPPYFDRRRTLT